jgi:hypothetical protein
VAGDGQPQYFRFSQTLKTWCRRRHGEALELTSIPTPIIQSNDFQRDIDMTDFSFDDLENKMCLGIIRVI